MSKYGTIITLCLIALAAHACSNAQVGTCTTNADCGDSERCFEGVCREVPGGGEGDGDFQPSDRDNDGVPDGQDNCVDIANEDQADQDRVLSRTMDGRAPWIRLG